MTGISEFLATTTARFSGLAAGKRASIRSLPFGSSLGDLKLYSVLGLGRIGGGFHSHRLAWQATEPMISSDLCPLGLFLPLVIKFELLGRSYMVRYRIFAGSTSTYIRHIIESMAGNAFSWPSITSTVIFLEGATAELLERDIYPKIIAL